jgi:hypothetical protein
VAWTRVESRTGSRSYDGPRPDPGLRRTWRWWLPLLAAGLTLSACGVHISKHGISGNILGHSFSAASGQLPGGFPSNVPQPDNSRVLYGGGADNAWDVAFAVTGSLNPGTAAYRSKLQSAGYTVSTIQSGSAPDTNASTPSPSTTITLTGSAFTAKNSQWAVDVVSGITSSKGGPLKAGEFAINITVVPVTSTSPPTS